jgi:hypothetical protein
MMTSAKYESVRTGSSWFGIHRRSDRATVLLVDVSMLWFGVTETTLVDRSSIGG